MLDGNTATGLIKMVRVYVSVRSVVDLCCTWPERGKHSHAHWPLSSVPTLAALRPVYIPFSNLPSATHFAADNLQPGASTTATTAQQPLVALVSKHLLGIINDRISGNPVSAGPPATNLQPRSSTLPESNQSGCAILPFILCQIRDLFDPFIATIS